MPSPEPISDGKLPSARIRPLYRAVQALGARLHAFLESVPDEERAAWEASIRTLLAALREAETAWASASLPSPATRERLLRFGKLLRVRREAAGLSREELAKRVKLSAATLKFLETATYPPSQASLIRLLGDELLGLSWDDVAFIGIRAPPLEFLRGAVAIRSVEAPPLNAFLSGTADPIRSALELHRQLQGAGGHIDQSAGYLDPLGAAAALAAWRSSSTERFPAPSTAAAILSAAGERDLRLISLGVADGAAAISLATHLREDRRPQAIELWLVDASFPLLLAAYRRATEELIERRGIKLFCLHGDVCQLPTFSERFGSTDRVRCIFALLGSALGDLDSPQRFLRHDLIAARGDLLLIEAPLAAASPTSRVELERRDPLFRSGLSEPQRIWLAGLARRYCTDAQDIQLSLELEASPGALGYAVAVIARVKTAQRGERRFSLHRFRRFDVEQLTRQLAEVGWELLKRADSDSKRSALLLYRYRRP